MATRPRGALIDWKPTGERRQAIIADLIAAYQEHYQQGTLPRGPRGIFYDLRPHGRGNGVSYRKYDSLHPKKSFGPMEAHQDMVQETLGLARRAGIIPEHWVADGRAQAGLANPYDESAEAAVASAVSIVRNAEKHFELDPQRRQPIYVEVLCEAADLGPRLARIANDLGVPVFMGGGFDGIKAKRAMGERAAERDVPTVVLHVGDRDKYGEDIYKSAGEDAVAWARRGTVVDLEYGASKELLDGMRDVILGAPGALIFFRLGLTPALAYDLDVLDADGKAEADAIPVPVMDQMLTEAIDALHDLERRDELTTEQEKQREGIMAKVLAQLRNGDTASDGDGETPTDAQ